MTRHVLIGTIVLLFAQVGQAQIIPAITSVFTEGDGLYIAGQNLPNGWRTKVRFGDNQLAVSSSSDTLIVARK